MPVFDSGSSSAARRLRSWRGWVVGVALLATPIALEAQTIGIALGSTPVSLLTPSAKLTVPVTLDLTNATGTNLASFQATVNWNATRLTFDSIRVVGTEFSLSSNTANATSGSISFNGFSATALSAGALANLYFTAAGSVGNTRLSLSPTIAGNEGGLSVLHQIDARSMDVCVVSSLYRWGDVTADGTVNILDAQQIARFTVGLSTSARTNQLITLGCP